MELDHVVEEGFLTKTSLNILINHALVNCPKLERIVGEWTKIPDRLVRISLELEDFYTEQILVPQLYFITNLISIQIELFIL